MCKPYKSKACVQCTHMYKLYCNVLNIVFNIVYNCALHVQIVPTVLPYSSIVQHTVQRTCTVYTYSTYAWQESVHSSPLHCFYTESPPCIQWLGFKGMVIPCHVVGGKGPGVFIYLFTCTVYGPTLDPRISAELNEFLYL